MQGGFWAFMADFDINRAGFIIAGLFIVVWAAAITYWKLGKLDRRWAPAASLPPDTPPGPDA